VGGGAKRRRGGIGAPARANFLLLLVCPTYPILMHGGMKMIEFYLMEFIKYVLLYGAIASPILLLGLKPKFYKLFKNCGLINKDEKVPFIYSKRKTSYGTEYTLHVPEGLCLTDFVKSQEAIETNLNCKVELLPSTNRKIVLKAFTAKQDTIFQYEFIKTKGLSFPLGYSHMGLVSHTMDDENPHLLIGGTSGSGKSVCLRAIITNIILNKSCILHLCDLKGGVEFAIFKRSSAVKTFAKDMMESMQLINELKAEMYRRLELFEKEYCVNLQEYNRKTKANLPKHLLVVDELANITLYDKDLTETISELLRMARAVGIHLILATQRPSAEVLPGTLKANVAATIAFKTRNHVNSQILLDRKGAEDLRGKGHGILQTNNEVEFQGLFLTSDESRELIKHTYVEKSNKVNVSGVEKRVNAKRSASN
jgi:S-DNA-T family DNA segregation ATPase FtsK/SpoIIIE